MTAAQTVSMVLAAGFTLDDCRIITPGLLFDMLALKFPDKGKDDE